MSTNRGLRPLDPIFDPSKRVGALSVGNTPGNTNGIDFPRFCMTGDVEPALSPIWAVDGTIPVAEMFITLVTGTWVEMNVFVNLVNVWTDTFDLTVSNGWAPSEGFTLYQNDGVQLELLDAETGSTGLTVVIRPDIGSDGILNF